MRFLLFFLFLLVLCVGPAQAHNPYMKKVKMLKGPQGEVLVLEKLYGDGIFFADPVRAQLIGPYGDVLAQSSVGSHLGVFCPSLAWCWVFPHGEFSLFAIPERLDSKKLEFSEKNAGEYISDKYRDYLVNPRSRRMHSDMVPKHTQNVMEEPRGVLPTLNFVTDYSLLPISPVVIALTHFLPLAVMFVLSITLYVMWQLYKYILSRVEGAWEILLHMMALIVFLGYLHLLGLALLVLFLTLTIPWLYLLLMVLLAFVVARRHSKKSRHAAALS